MCVQTNDFRIKVSLSKLKKIEGMWLVSVTQNLFSYPQFYSIIKKQNFAALGKTNLTKAYLGSVIKS